ncbi:MAG: hypothetical protein KF749_14395 [Bacteroidetes bacterium]|nr:hypothetical protein [Bacteroidota bacterium]MCW5895692.1 hypothetical protein [Bacteroidota bacterium]
MWYHIYVAVAALILMTALVGMVHETLQRIDVRLIARYGWVALTCGLLIVWAHGLGFISSPTRYPDSIRWIGMTMDPAGTYISGSERSRLVEKLNSMSSERKVTRVSFDPEGDALAIWKPGEFKFSPYYPMFTDVEPDVIVVHVSELHPRWWKRNQTRETMKRWQVGEEDLFFVSDDGDRWYVKFVGEDRPTGQQSPKILR